jgi:hypothetical protein
MNFAHRSNDSSSIDSSFGLAYRYPYTGELRRAHQFFACGLGPSSEL